MDRIGLIVATICASALLSQPSSCESAQRRQMEYRSVGEVQRDIGVLVGRQVTVRGYLTIEQEDRALWSKITGYGEPEGQCITIDVSDALWNRRESLNRAFVTATGVLKGTPCKEGSCSCDSVWLTNPLVKVISTQHPQVLTADETNEFLSVNRQVEGFGEIRELGVKLQKALTPSSGTRRIRHNLVDLFAPERRSLATENLDTVGSRAWWLLFGSSNSLRRLVRHRHSRFDVVQMQQIAGEKKKAFLCYCSDSRCAPRSENTQRIYFRAAGDTNICIPVQQEADKQWYLEAGYLVGKPEEDVIE